MHHDPFQTQSYAGFGGAPNPFGSPLAALQTTINPFNPIGINPLAMGGLTLGQQNPFGQQNPLLGLQHPGYGGNPYAAAPQLQYIASILAAQANPWQNQITQNPLTAAILQNPVLAQQIALQAAQTYLQPQSTQSPYGQPQYGQSWPMQQQFGQQTGTPFGQSSYGPQFGQGYQLAPQSWVGQPGPSQFGGRGLY